MTTNHQPDAAIDKTLAALNSAQPPAGLESRIAARLAQQPVPSATLRDRITGYTLASAWWRGATAGAAIAALAVAAVLLLQHTTRTAPRTQAVIIHPVPTPVSATAAPCPQPAILRTHVSTPPTAQIASSPTPTSSSHPSANSPLTTQERALIRFAQTADPKAIAALNPEKQAQLEAENDAQFNKFFYHPPPPPQPKIDPPPPATLDQPTANPATEPVLQPDSAAPTDQTAPETN